MDLVDGAAVLPPAQVDAELVLQEAGVVPVELWNQLQRRHEVKGAHRYPIFDKMVKSHTVSHNDKVRAVLSLPL